MEIILGQERIEIEIDDNKITGITKKKLHQHDDEIVIICEDDSYFANVFSSVEGGYAIYWYEAKDLEQFLKGDGAVELEEVDGAHCTGKIVDALLWAYCQE